MGAECAHGTLPAFDPKRPVVAAGNQTDFSAVQQDQPFFSAVANIDSAGGIEYQLAAVAEDDGFNFTGSGAVVGAQLAAQRGLKAQPTATDAQQQQQTFQQGAAIQRGLAAGLVERAIAEFSRYALQLTLQCFNALPGPAVIFVLLVPGLPLLPLVLGDVFVA
ncbi:hypothetical protein D3C72_1578990 [compost metagenome]